MADLEKAAPATCPVSGKPVPKPGTGDDSGEQKTLVLTGASQGIGHATAKLFQEHGWRVLTCSRRAFTSACPWQEGPEDHIQIDLGDPDHRSIGLAELKKRLAGGALHALVNNAGISPKGEEGERLGPTELAWRPGVWFLR